VRISLRRWSKNNGAIFEIAAKTPAEKMERTPAENTSPFASRAKTVIVIFLNTLLFSSCFSIANYIHHIRNVVFFPTQFPSNCLLLCPIDSWIRRLAKFRFSIASFIFALLPSISIASLWNAFSKGFVFVPCGGNFIHIFVSSARCHTSRVTSGNIQCTYSEGEFSLCSPRNSSRECNPSKIH